MSDAVFLMRCGHRSTFITKEKKPVCVICFGSDSKSTQIINDPELEGRLAKCTSCSKLEPSEINLAFFCYQPEKDTDYFYCGCGGWD